MMSTNPVATGRARRVASGFTLALCALAALVPPLARAQTVLSDTPIFSSQGVPGNLALPLSVEWPTVSRAAYPSDIVAYSSGSTYLGYFDPAKCYLYNFVATESPTAKNYFYPAGLAAVDGSGNSLHTCSGKWSGNFLNWAATAVIDPFRWAMTGGYRAFDTTTGETILEKAWHSRTSLFPNPGITGSTAVAAATPLNWSTLNLRIQNLGNKMRFTNSGSLGGAGSDGSGGGADTGTATPYNPSSPVSGSTTYEVVVRVKVCDPTLGAGGVETNCVQYGSNWKPEGLIQKYANKMRYSVFSYLNDSTSSTTTPSGPQRDGGVLRARQKFVGPTRPVPGSTAVANAAKEWDPTTGVIYVNPDATDATDTNTIFGPDVAVADSGVMNYITKFGELRKSAYKSKDPVSELYYAALRYFKNKGNVPSYTNMSGASGATKTTWIDGFPVIATWDDPIQYSCQRNFILGIGDIYTHNDKNLPGSTSTAGQEPGLPTAVSGDTSYTTTNNAITATDKVFALQSLAAPNRDDYSGRNNSAGIAGLAYDAHTRDIRTDWPGMRVDTYWVDVLEQPFVANNQFYLAAKYGGFTVPDGYGDPYARTTALPDSWWHTASGSPDTNYVGTQLRPDNYFTGGRPDLMIAGLNAAFSRIASQLGAYTTSFATSLPQVAQSGNASYSAQFDASNWTGEITASTLSFDASGNATTVKAWTFSQKLAAQVAGTGWSTGRRVVTWNGTGGVQFCISGASGCTKPITAAQKTALDTSYVSGDDSANYLNYLRGDQANEVGTSGAGAYRTRVKLLGDIVGSKARPVGPPSFPFSDSANPGYSAFRNNATYAARPTVVYVASNDGMMHAVRGDLSAPPGGVELFAYVPSALFQGPNGTPNVDGLASLGKPSMQHHFMVDATPNVYDVDFSRTAGSTPTLLGDWRSILIGGLGKGGKGYYAIDVTDPVGMAATEASVASKVLWEFTDTDLGYTYGDPIVAKTPKWGWVVIIPSGYNNADGKGYFFILNPKTGALLEKISTNVGSSTSSAGLAFANAFVLDGSDGTIDAVYAGDLLGNVWRWDVTAITGFYPAPVNIASLTDAEVGGNPQPVTSRPLIEVHPTLKKRFVLVGTGRLLDTTDVSNTQVQSFYSIMDGTNARFNQPSDLPTGISFPITRSVLVANTNAVTTGAPYVAARPMGWVEDLDTAGDLGWRVITDATTLLGSVAWATTLPNVVDPCQPTGKGRVYARDFGTGVSTILTAGTTSAALFIGSANTVTDLHYLSVDGKATLLGGTSKGETPKYDTSPLSTLGLRRLNWRELQTVE